MNAELTRAISEIHRTAIEAWYGNDASKMTSEQLAEIVPGFIHDFHDLFMSSSNFSDGDKKTLSSERFIVNLFVRDNEYDFHYRKFGKTENLRVVNEKQVIVAQVFPDGDRHNELGARIMYSEDGGSNFIENRVYVWRNMTRIFGEYLARTKS